MGSHPTGLAVLASPREQGMNKAANVKLGFQLPSFGRSGMSIPDTRHQEITDHATTFPITCCCRTGLRRHRSRSVLAGAPYKPAGGTHLWQSTSQQDALSHGHKHGLQPPAPQFPVLHAEITSDLLTAQQGASSCSTSRGRGWLFKMLLSIFL